MSAGCQSCEVQILCSPNRLMLTGKKREGKILATHSHTHVTMVTAWARMWAAANQLLVHEEHSADVSNSKHTYTMQHCSIHRCGKCCCGAQQLIPETNGMALSSPITILLRKHTSAQRKRKRRPSNIQLYSSPRGMQPQEARSVLRTFSSSGWEWMLHLN